MGRLDVSSFQAGAELHSAGEDGRSADSGGRRRYELSKEGKKARSADLRSALGYCVSNDLI
jgi:hypothetical protein